MPSKPQNIDILWGCCKLYHKTTWFETDNARIVFYKALGLQIISQNYVVWNSQTKLCVYYGFFVANYITKLRGLKQLDLRVEFAYKKLQIISQNYVVWNSENGIKGLTPISVANYITKLRGLKPRIC